jgi:glycosyltransferase involved in cell wall biosynthesis
VKIALFAHQIDTIGGAEVGTRRLAQRLCRRGHKITLISTQAISQWRGRRGQIAVNEEGMRVVRLPVWQRSSRVYTQVLAIESLGLPLLLHGHDIFHIRRLDENAIVLAKAARRAGVKTLCVPMASGAYGDVAVFPPSVPHEAHLFNRMSALTEAIREEVVHWGMRPECVSIIPNGVDSEVFQRSTNRLLAQNVIFVGQFRPEKRVDLLLEAWGKLQSDFPEATLTLVGGGVHFQKYVEIAAQRSIRAQFVPTLPSAQIAEVLQRQSIFVMSGVSEGMSNALLEAMAVGLAPVVSDTPGNRALITPEVNGLCYAPDSPDGLASTLRRILSDGELRTRLGVAARATILEGYTLDAVAMQYERLYKSMVEEGRDA